MSADNFYLASHRSKGAGINEDDEDHVAQLAIQQFSSIEEYTEAMKHNLEHFSEIMENRYYSEKVL